MNTDTSEKGLELLIAGALTGLTRDQIEAASVPGAAEVPRGYHGAGYVLGRPQTYDRANAVDLRQLQQFLRTTQPDAYAKLDLENDSPTRQQFLARLRGEIAKRGIVDVLRKGVSHGALKIDLFYGTPSPGNDKAKQLWESNVFSITRQLQYSLDETQLALDLCLFINGLPIATFELKNRLTKQTVDDAVQQYMRDRDHRELLFQFPRCLAHFAVDDQQVKFCTRLQGAKSWFLPFNKGWHDGAGNPPNPDGLKTDYLWQAVLSREGLTDILENYAQLVVTKDEKTGRKKETLIFPRYHQRDAVRKLLGDAKANGPGQRYLIQHSAGSGKSNSIAWLAHQLVGLEEGSTPIFDSVIVVTDRVVLDKQIRDTIKQFAQVGNTVGHAERSGQLKEFLQSGKKIIITTVQKFPFVLADIGDEHRHSKFAILIDEAHSSQSGRTAAKMNIALSEVESPEEDADVEEKINQIMEARKMLPNASYFAFTATPKNKTLEIFGVPDPQADGTVKHRPFHSYTMKQAIQEGFILDVLANFTPVNSYYKIVKTIEDDPAYDTLKAQKKLKAYVEGHPHAIRQKSKIMIDHFHDHVQSKIGGQARAMVVTGSIRRAVEYFHAFDAFLRERKSPFRAIVAFSGEHDFGAGKITEASLNGFSSVKIVDRIQEDPYRFLICADKFQTGYDEPLLHSMYVDKQLSGIKAVQTLSRLNRACPNKTDTFVLDFQNDSDQILESFSEYYRTTVLSRETDPNRLHDLKADLDGHQIYDQATIDTLVERFLAGADRAQLEPLLEFCVEAYTHNLSEDQQVDFKGKAKSFIRTYGFLAAILPYSLAEWEKLSIFLNFLVPKLPAPVEEDLAKGVLESIDMDSYRAEKRNAIAILLPDSDAEIDPSTVGGGGRMPEPEIDHLSNILRTFNEQFGNVEWFDEDKLKKIVEKIASNVAYQNAQANSDKENARLEFDRTLDNSMQAMINSDLELFKQFSENPAFKRWLSDTAFNVTYNPPAA